jgi:hypothetical protein
MHSHVFTLPLDSENNAPLPDVPYVTYVGASTPIAARESAFFGLNIVLDYHRKGATAELLRSTMGRMLQGATEEWDKLIAN